VRLYLVDGSNAVRRRDYDPRFPEMDEARHESFLERVDALAEPLEGSVRIEIFFDGPRRRVFPVSAPVRVRFALDGDADDAILGSARHRIRSGKGVVVVTEDGGLAREIESEGGKTLRFAAFFDRLRERRA